MLASCTSTLGKEERIFSKKQIDELFNGKCSKTMTAYPIRVVYAVRTCVQGEQQAQVMVSVSKRYFKHAVQRNRVKRQLREAYRKNKWILLSELSTLPTKGVSMAFLWMDGHLRDSMCVEKQMCDLLNRIKGKI